VKKITDCDDLQHAVPRNQDLQENEIPHAIPDVQPAGENGLSEHHAHN
jgi:hypothetical protein